MLIKSLIQESLIGRAEQASATNRELMNQFIDDVLNKTPREVYYNWWGKDSIMSDIDKSLVDDYPLTIHSGFNTSTKFYCTSAKSITIANIISSSYENQEFIIGKTHIQQYDLNKFNVLNDIILSMTISKYDITSLTKEHIIFTCLCTMFRFFKAFDGDKWLIQISDIQQIWHRICDLDISHYEQIAVQYGFGYTPEIKRTRQSFKKRPTCADDLISCFEDGMTQTQKKEAIMKWWKCGSTTARKYMSDFGLTDDTYTRTDYKEAKELHEHIDDAVDEIADEIKIQSSDVIARINDVSEQIDEQTETLREIERIKVDNLMAQIDARMNFQNQVIGSKLDEQFANLTQALSGFGANMFSAIKNTDK